MPNHPAEEMSEAEQFEEAIALNKKLKAMLDAASAKERAGGPGRGYSAGGPVRSASNRASIVMFVPSLVDDPPEEPEFDRIMTIMCSFSGGDVDRRACRNLCWTIFGASLDHLRIII